MDMTEALRRLADLRTAIEQIPVVNQGDREAQADALESLSHVEVCVRDINGE